MRAPSNTLMSESCNIRNGPRLLHAVADRIDQASERIGRVVSWLTLATVVICFLTVYLRYALHIGHIWLQEMYIWTHVAAITMGAGFVWSRGGFVRVDILHAKFTDRGRAWVNLLGTIFLMLPFLCAMAATGWGFFHTSWMMNESSQQETGLPALWLLKSGLLIFVMVVGVQGIGVAARSLAILMDPGCPQEPDSPQEAVHAG